MPCIVVLGGQGDRKTSRARRRALDSEGGVGIHRPRDPLEHAERRSIIFMCSRDHTAQEVAGAPCRPQD